MWNDHGMSTTTNRWMAFGSGVLIANSTPHLLVAARGERMLTPLAGKDSGPGVNLAWGTMNIAAGAALARRAARRPEGPGRAVVPFLAGAGAYALWSVAYEILVEENPGR